MSTELAIIIASGVTSSGGSVIANNVVNVASGGTIEAYQVLSGALLQLSAGGIVGAGETTIAGVMSGGTATSGANLQIFNGGVDRGTTLLSGADEVVYGSAANVTVNGSIVFVDNIAGNPQTAGPGSISGFVVNGGGVITLNGPGSVASNTVLSSGGTQIVSSGNTAVTTLVSAGGTEVISSGGTAVNTDNLGGLVLVSSGGTELVSASTVSNITVKIFGIEDVLSGGVAISTTLNEGFLNISSGGVTSDTMLVSGSAEAVGNGGTSINDTIISTGLDAETINASGDMSAMLEDGGFIVEAGGTAIGTMISGQDNNDVWQGLVSSGGTLIGGTVSAANLYVNSGGVVINTTVESGSILRTNGVTSNTTVNSGGTEQILSGGTAVLNGSAGAGVIDFFNAGGDVVVSGTSMPTNTISGFGAGDTIDLADIAYSSLTGELISGNVLTISAGGSTYMLNVPGITSANDGLSRDANGGVLVDGGIASSFVTSEVSGVTDYFVSGTMINKGASLTLSAGQTLAVTSGTTTTSLTYTGGAITVSGGGTLIGTVSSATILSGGTELVSSGVIATSTTVSSGGTLIDSAGSVQGTSIDGGTLILSGAVGGGNNNFGANTSGGTAILGSGTGAANGGAGFAGFTNLSSGNTVDVLSGGGAELQTIGAGGVINVASGGFANGETISAGGTLLAETGGLLDGTTSVTSGGLLSGGTATSGANLQIFNGGVDRGTLLLSGADEVVYGSAANVTVNGAIVFVDNIAGNPQTAGPGSISGFVVNGGGVITLNGPGSVASNTVLSSGGTQIVSSGNTAVTTLVSAGGTEVISSGGTAVNTDNLGGLVLVSSGGTELVSASTVSNITVETFGIEDVLSGGIAISTTLNTGFLNISSGGVTSDSRVSGSEIVGNGGTSINDTISGSPLFGAINASGNMSAVLEDGGFIVEAGGTAIGTMISGPANGVWQGLVSSGGTLIGGTVSAADLYVNSGGLVINTTVESGSILRTNGVTSNTTVNSGGTEQILSGATAVLNGSAGAGVIDFFNAGGDVVVSGTSMPTNTISGFGAGDTIDLADITYSSLTGESISGNVLTISAGGSTYMLNVPGITSANDGLSRDANGGVLIGGGVTSSNFVTSEVSGVTDYFVSGTQINEGASLTLSAGQTLAVTSGTTTTSLTYTGGAITVSGGGTLIGTVSSATILSGGTELVSAGVTATSTTVSGGGTLLAEAGGLLDGTNSIKGGLLSGGTLAGSGDAVDVSLGGTAVGVTASNGGNEVVSSGGTSISAVVLNGAISAVGSGDTLMVTGGGGIVVGPGGIATDTVLSGLGVALNATAAFVSSGGEMLSTTIIASREIVALGGIASATVINSGGVLDFVGVSIATVVNAGGNELVESAGVASGTIVNSGGTQNVVSGAVASSTTVNSGGFEAVAAGGDIAGTTTVNGGGLLSGGTVVSGGIVQILSGGSLSGRLTLSGSTAVLNGTAGTGIIAFAGSGGDVRVNGMSMPTNLISGFGAGDVIDLANIASGSITSVSEVGNTATIFAGGSSYVLNIAGAAADGYKLVDDGHGGTFFEVCFAEGTHIATPRGETVVEQLAIGDLVTTLKGAKPVTWVGHRSVDVSTLKDPESGRLVRIRAGAFGETTPHRDLLVTQEHCVFAGSGLIPARMLVNGRSIIIDRSINAYSYYHVELEEHGILVAEGLTTESYLDTGNRANFANYEAPALRPSFALDAQHKNWATHAAAPLTVARAVVEPVWRRLEARARRMNVALVTAPSALTEDPGLHLGTDTGMTIRPVRNTGGRYVFSVPAGVTGLRLLSRTARPSETAGPFVDDRRALGVLVGEVVVWQGRKRIAMDQHLAISGLNGWFDFETGAQRWTAGDAELPVALDNKPSLVEIEVLSAGPYLVETADHVARLGKIA